MVESSAAAGKIDHLPELLDGEVDIQGSFVASHYHSFDLALCQQSKGMGTNVCGLGRTIDCTLKPTTRVLVWYGFIKSNANCQPVDVYTITPQIC